MCMPDTTYSLSVLHICKFIRIDWKFTLRVGSSFFVMDHGAKYCLISPVVAVMGTTTSYSLRTLPCSLSYCCIHHIVILSCFLPSTHELKSSEYLTVCLRHVAFGDLMTPVSHLSCRDRVERSFLPHRRQGFDRGVAL